MSQMGSAKIKTLNIKTKYKTRRGSDFSPIERSLPRHRLGAGIRTDTCPIADLPVKIGKYYRQGLAIDTKIIW
jgi:hypothetical protein